MLGIEFGKVDDENDGRHSISDHVEYSSEQWRLVEDSGSVSIEHIHRTT